MRLVTILLTAALGAAFLGTATARADHHEAGEAAADREVVVAAETELTGKVVAIDRKARTVTVLGSQGNTVKITAPKEGKNFDQIAVGDDVAAIYARSVGLAIGPREGATPGASAASVVKLAPAGATPGGVIADTVRIEAVVRAIDLEARTVTLDVPEGPPVTIAFKEGVDLSRVKVGEQVVATRTEALAISITKPDMTPPVSTPPKSE